MRAGVVRHDHTLWITEYKDGQFETVVLNERAGAVLTPIDLNELLPCHSRFFVGSAFRAAAFSSTRRNPL